MPEPTTAGEDRVDVVVDATACVGSMTCVALAPEHFEMDGATSRPLRSPTRLDDHLRDAEESCPVAAIRLRALDGRG